MRYVRIFNSAQGASHFEDLDIALVPIRYAPPSGEIDVSEPFPATRTVFFSVPIGYFGDWHPAPRRQLFFPLSGQMEIQVSDGDQRTFRAGDIVLVEDVLDPGHTTRNIGDDPATGAFVHLD